MSYSIRKLVTVSLAVAALSPLSSVAHFDDQQMGQSYRQSYFALLANNFGPMASTVKGEIPWDQDRMAGWAKDFTAVTELNLMRGFAPGTEKGTTRAKPEIWENTADFESKLEDMRVAARALEAAVNSGDREQVGKAVGDAGGTCKACHDDYKSKDYLY